MNGHERITVPCLVEGPCKAEACDCHGECPSVLVDVCELCTCDGGEPQFGALLDVVPWPCEPSKRQHLTVVRP